MTPVGQALSAVLWLYLLVLIFRLVMEYVFMFARSYRPRGIMLLLSEVTWTLTDPPLKALRKVVPPLRLGGVALDLAFILLIVIVNILLYVTNFI